MQQRPRPSDYAIRIIKTKSPREQHAIWKEVPPEFVELVKKHIENHRAKYRVRIG